MGGAAFDYELPTLEDVLNEGLHGLGASPTHIAFRGTFQILGRSIMQPHRIQDFRPNLPSTGGKLWLGLALASPSRPNNRRLFTPLGPWLNMFGGYNFMIPANLPCCR